MYKKIGIIREGKQPADRRTPLTPKQCKEVLMRGVDIAVRQRALTEAVGEQDRIPAVGVDD